MGVTDMRWFAEMKLCRSGALAANGCYRHTLVRCEGAAPTEHPALFHVNTRPTCQARACALLAAYLLPLAATAELPPVSGHLQLQSEPRQANVRGPLAQADALQAGLVSLPASRTSITAELRSQGVYWAATATLQQQDSHGQPAQEHAWFNELTFTTQALGWQLSVGKKIVAWDVGYAWRPNDVVQQEERRNLIAATAEGRPVLLAERFEAERAWSLVWVNPSAKTSARGAAEPALAARLYLREGALDWHGFARWGAHTGSSLGLAAAWVASDALELHASVRALQHADSRSQSVSADTLVSRNLWQDQQSAATGQALVGASWTHAQQVSLLAEAWWYGSTPSAAQWRAWSARNQTLAKLPAQGAPASAVAANLAWQAAALADSGNLQRSNVYLRLSWEHENWQPSLDLLYHPADGGQLWTAALLWKGDRVRLQGGIRVSAGGSTTVFGQLPTSRQGYLSGTWLF